MRKGQRFGFEFLESRLTPAGNVTAVFSDGSLLVTGDRFDNAIRITEPSPDAFTIASEDGSTTINGQTGPVTVARVTKDVIVRLGRGDDTLQLGSEGGRRITVERDLRVDGGSGDNTLRVVSSLSVDRHFHTRFGDGRDEMEVSAPLRVGRDFRLSTGDGGSRVVVRRDSGQNTIGGDFSIRSAFGPDYNDIRDTNVRGDVLFDVGEALEFDESFSLFSSVNSGAQVTVGGDVTFLAQSESSNDLLDTNVNGDVSADLSSLLSRFSLLSVGSSRIDSRPYIRGDVDVTIAGGAASVSLADLGFGTNGGLLILGDLEIETGDGNDGISFGNLEVRGDTEIETGIRDDFVFINDSLFRSDFSLSTGRGVDQLLIETASSPQTRGTTDFRRRVEVDLGTGDDFLQLGVAGDNERQVRFYSRAEFDGGRGTDRLDAANFVRFDGRPSFRSFELVGPKPDTDEF